MTVITKPLSEKKSDKLDQPLVVAECLPNRDAESGAGDVPPVDPRVLVFRARARRASSVTTACLLMMALLVMCCGILAGFYLYKQFAYSQSEIFRWQRELFQNRSKHAREQEELMKNVTMQENEEEQFQEARMIDMLMTRINTWENSWPCPPWKLAPIGPGLLGLLGNSALLLRNSFSIFSSTCRQMHRLRGWCRIPYTEQNLDRFEEDPIFSDSNKMSFEMPRSAESRYLNEEFDIDGDSNSYEKITVPNFDGGRSSRFIHDFNANKTGIIDVDAHRCFVMPLNRTQVLPPRDLIDLVRKMWDGYYEVDTDMVKETMRVVLPPLKDPKTAGPYIERECNGYPIYQLEKIVSGVFKRSVSPDPATFTSFAGKNYVQLKIANEEELAAYEAAHPRT